MIEKDHTTLFEWLMNNHPSEYYPDVEPINQDLEFKINAKYAKETDSMNCSTRRSSKL